MNAVMLVVEGVGYFCYSCLVLKLGSVTLIPLLFTLNLLILLRAFTSIKTLEA